MKNQPRQFGLLALFVLTTTVAVAFAVIRLPIDVRWKTRLVVLFGCCFLYWAADCKAASRVNSRNKNTPVSFTQNLAGVL
jgi:hypothetical protein